ncbi:MAG: universal stress protein [Promethearchaeota archaeon]
MVKIYKKILFATDGSPCSEEISKKIVEFQKEWNCKVVIFHSIKDHTFFPIVNFDKNRLLSDYRNNEDLHNELGKRILKETGKIFERLDIPIELRLIKKENSANYIKRIIKEEKFDLVIICMEGYHNKSKMLFLPTDFSRVLEENSCDILIVP